MRHRAWLYSLHLRKMFALQTYVTQRSHITLYSRPVGFCLCVCRRRRRVNGACTIAVGIQVRPFYWRKVLQVWPRGEAPSDGFRYAVSGQALRAAATQVVPADDRDALRDAPSRRRTRRDGLQLPRSRDSASSPRRQHRLQTEELVSYSQVRHVAQPVLRDVIECTHPIQCPVILVPTVPIPKLSPHLNSHHIVLTLL